MCLRFLIQSQGYLIELKKGRYPSMMIGRVIGKILLWRAFGKKKKKKKKPTKLLVIINLPFIYIKILSDFFHYLLLWPSLLIFTIALPLTSLELGEHIYYIYVIIYIYYIYLISRTKYWNLDLYSANRVTISIEYICIIYVMVQISVSDTKIGYWN